MNKIDKNLCGLIKGRKKTQVNRSRIKTRKHTTELRKIKSVRGCYKTICQYIRNLNEMDKFLETHKLPKGLKNKFNKFDENI
jgi:hypothetical protein